ncbi:hypothetical protein [Tabrizicola soli]|uniref:Uncharacterized protein n=1 Tax=Tabrizicola soli TaxID=2185115 RepID=A0ABV7DY11_9RHOB|nr:hypothetical protein [Tabrizicola soli]
MEIFLIAEKAKERKIIIRRVISGSDLALSGSARMLKAAIRRRHLQRTGTQTREEQDLLTAWHEAAMVVWFDAFLEKRLLTKPLGSPER